MENSTEQYRVGFEAWAREECGLTDDDLKRPHGRYFWQRAGNMWESWIASKREASTEPSALQCPKCGVDRLSAPCGNPQDCGMIATAQAVGALSDDAKDAPELYTCIGKGGEYELIGDATGAGELRNGLTVRVYRDISSGAFYYRTRPDFDARMAPVAAKAQESAPSSESIATWQERIGDTTPAHEYPDFMRAEIRDLRAALARRATAGTTAAPSVMDDRRAFEEWFNGTMYTGEAKEALLIGWQARSATAGNAATTELTSRLRMAVEYKDIIDHADVLALANEVERLATPAATAAPGDLTDEQIDNELESAREYIVEGFGYKYNETDLAAAIRRLATHAGAAPK